MMCRSLFRHFAPLLIGLSSAVFPLGLSGQPKPAVPATATLTGTIVDEGGIPVEGARVGIPATTLSTVSDAGGVFRLSGVPPGRASVEVSKEGFSTLEFDFEIAATVTVSLKLTLVSLPPPPMPDSVAAPADTARAAQPAAAADAAPANSRKVTFRGTVIDSGGSPIFGAVIEEAATGTRTISDSLGRFRLLGLDPGLLFVRVRKLGYLAEYFPITGVGGRNVTKTVQLRAVGQQLATVEVRDKALSRDGKLRGFYERAAKGTGIFIERDELLRRNASQLSDVLRGRNGVTVYGGGANGNTIAGRGFRMAGGQGPGVCPLPLILDGVYIKLQDGLTVDRIVNIQDVRAIEVYATGPQVPAELANGQTDCGAIVVWTR
jgi:Carboxypeptidase regulatory-like domain